MNLLIKDCFHKLFEEAINLSLEYPYRSYLKVHSKASRLYLGLTLKSWCLLLKRKDHQGDTKSIE